MKKRLGIKLAIGFTTLCALVMAASAIADTGPAPKTTTVPAPVHHAPVAKQINPCI